MRGLCFPQMFPIVDASGVAKPIIFYNVEQLVKAGIERVFIVVQVWLRWVAPTDVTARRIVHSGCDTIHN